MQLEALSHIDPHQFFNLRQPGAVEGQRLETRVSGFVISNDFSGRLNVTTAEGDTVTLTADMETDFRSWSHIPQVADDRTTGKAEAKSIYYAVQREFGIAVDGDLNKEELHDLKILLGNIANIFRGFFQG